MAELMTVKTLLDSAKNSMGKKKFNKCSAAKVKSLPKKEITVYSVKCFEEYSNPKGHLVGLKLYGDKGPLEDRPVKAMCTCEAWAYWGSEYHAMQNKYKMKEIKGIKTDGSFPEKRDPRSKNTICKHVYLSLRKMLKDDKRKNYGK